MSPAVSPSLHPGWAGAPRGLRALVVAAPVLVAGVPVAVSVGRTPPFRDEVATAQLAALPLGDLWRATEHVDRVVLPYLLLMKGWLGVAGDSTLALRVPSVLAALGLVAVVAVLGGRLAGPVGGALAGLVVAVTPLSGATAVLARPYAGAALAATGAVLVLHQALGSGRRAWWVAHAALVAASVLLQPLAVAALPAQVALAAVTPGRHRWRRLLGSWALALAMALLVAAGARGQQGQVGWIPELGVGGAAAVLRGVLSDPVAWFALTGAVVGLVRVATRRPAPWWWVGGALLLGPPLLLAVVSVVLQPAFVGRYLFLVPSGAALLAGGAAGAAADVVARRRPEPLAPGRRAAAVLLVAVPLLVAAVLLGGTGGSSGGGSTGSGTWSANPGSPLAEAVGDVLQPGDTLVVEQRVGWGGYAATLARAWGDDDLALALGRRAVLGDLGDVTRTVGSVAPTRTVTGASRSGAPSRVVLLSLRSTAADRFLEATSAGCTAGAPSTDPRLGDSRLWVLRCDSTPGATELSAVPDHPDR